ncbi:MULTISPECIES: 2-dehydropantoate 2-reductase [unclassified Beijerinckia]|uniref:ketopantoate reductase family protein n=1 Tax=unclassified Beijerinckia TaxID=2638183 RepID=UPI00089A86D4|nr:MULTISPECIES: 2-dehydropantoate 2-reductase [unclassified Beijerinckia]MDH7794409.1 2-dehydropantoate 2-reductase [Beijerinckia sp. GAS462]SEB61374.1 ketopantoate reductase [Beijerinckia sp. 28-YEA-48]
MKIMIVGAGAIGGWLGAVLARGGADVSLLARGATLDAVRRQGLTLREGEATSTYQLAAAANPTELPTPDLILFSVKTHALAEAARSVTPVLAKGPAIMTAMNGLPWWFLDGGPLAGDPLRSIDPDDAIATAFAPCHPIGAVVHASTRVESPGVIRAVKIDRLIIGDATRQTSDLTRTFAAIVERGGAPCPITSDIRAEIWMKLAGNSNTNPLSALTRLSATPLLETPVLRELLLAMMAEFEAVGRRLGMTAQMPAAERLIITARLGNFRTSMLEDADAGRRLEIDGLLGCIVEIADRLGEPVPVSRTVYALGKGLDLSAALTAR